MRSPWEARPDTSAVADFLALCRSVMERIGSRRARNLADCIGTTREIDGTMRWADTPASSATSRAQAYRQRRLRLPSTSRVSQRAIVDQAEPVVRHRAELHIRPPERPRCPSARRPTQVTRAGKLSATRLCRDSRGAEVRAGARGLAAALHLLQRYIFFCTSLAES